MFENIFKKKLLITICAPTWDDIKYWGEFHFACSLGKEFEKYGYRFKIKLLREVEKRENNYDLHIHLRGIKSFKYPKKAKFSIIWYLCHPDNVDFEEFERFDLILVGSLLFANKIKAKASLPVFFLPQATDNHLFYPSYNSDFAYDLVFVGNTRGIFRESVKYAIKLGLNLRVWGREWNNFIDKKYIVNDYFPNEKLHFLYSSSKIVINDHWEDMKTNGFVNNRVYDVFACGGFVLSDYVKGMEKIFGNKSFCYHSYRDFEKKIKFYLSHPLARKRISLLQSKNIHSHHLVLHRVKTILKLIGKFKPAYSASF